MLHLEMEVNGRAADVTVRPEGGRLRVSVDGREFLVDARAVEGFFYSLVIDGRAWEVTVEEDAEGFRVQTGSEAVRVLRRDPLRRAGTGSDGATGAPAPVRAVMPGKVVRVLVKEGEEVERDQPLLVLEAMKMENEVLAPRAGRVEKLAVRDGQPVEAGAELLVLA